MCKNKLKVLKMDKVEVLEAEIKRKIIFIQKYLLKSRASESGIVGDIPKYLDSIAKLEKENAELKAESNKVGEEHNADLKQIDELVSELSKLVETNNA